MPILFSYIIKCIPPTPPPESPVHVRGHNIAFAFAFPILSRLGSFTCTLLPYPQLEVLLFSSLLKSSFDLASPRLASPHTPYHFILSLHSTFIRIFIQYQTLTRFPSSQNEHSCNSLNLQQHISFFPRTLHRFTFFSASYPSS